MEVLGILMEQDSSITKRNNDYILDMNKWLDVENNPKIVCPESSKVGKGFTLSGFKEGYK